MNLILYPRHGLHVELFDFHPPNEDYLLGFAMNLSDTIFRARFHRSWEGSELLKPRKIYKFNMISRTRR